MLKAFNELLTAFVSDADKVFKSLTSDNGSEFASLSELEKVSNILVYYAHPYTSWEKGSIENHNGLFRRFIPKGKNISDYSLEYIARVVRWVAVSRRLCKWKKLAVEFVEESSEAVVQEQLIANK